MSKSLPANFFDGDSAPAPTEDPALGDFLEEIKSAEAEANEEALADADEGAADDDLTEGVIQHALLNKIARLHRKRAGDERLEEADGAELERVLDADQPSFPLAVEDVVVIKALSKRRKAEAEAAKVTDEDSLLGFSF